MQVTDLVADAGRPDASELSRVVAVRFAHAASGSPDAPDGEFAPTGTVSSTPANALELAPGDVVGLTAAGRAWAEVQADKGLSDTLMTVARDAADAHLRLAERLSHLQRRAVEIFAGAESLGIDGPTLGSRDLVLTRVAREPGLADVIDGPLNGLIEVRLDWVQATQSFIDDLREAREAFGIAAW